MGKFDIKPERFNLSSGGIGAGIGAVAGSTNEASDFFDEIFTGKSTREGLERAGELEKEGRIEAANIQRESLQDVLETLRPGRERGERSAALLESLGAVNLEPSQDLLDLEAFETEQTERLLSNRLASSGLGGSTVGQEQFGRGIRALGAGQTKRRFGRALQLRGERSSRLMALINAGIGASSQTASAQQGFGTNLANLTISGAASQGNIAIAQGQARTAAARNVLDFGINLAQLGAGLPPRRRTESGTTLDPILLE